MAKAATITAPAVKTAAPKGARFVTVACKFPAGIVLQLCKRSTYIEHTRAGGSMERERFDKVGPVHVVRGPSTPNGQVPRRYKRPEVEGGYALTHNIPADFWEEWLRQNAENPIVTSKMIFAHTVRDHTSGEAQDLHETRSGFEPLEPDSDPRAPRSLDPNVTSIETEEGRKAQMSQLAPAED